VHIRVWEGKVTVDPDFSYMCKATYSYHMATATQATTSTWFKLRESKESAVSHTKMCRTAHLTSEYDTTVIS
jgi:hypothetical protein